MRFGRFLFWSMVLGLAACAALPGATAQDRLEITQVSFAEPGGRPVTGPAEDRAVEILVRVENQGDASQSASPVTVSIEVTGPAGRETLAPKNLIADRSADGETLYAFTWIPPVKGEYTLTAKIEPDGAPFTQKFDVYEDALPAGNVVERVLDYAWLVILLAVAVVLSVLVASRRRETA